MQFEFGSWCAIQGLLACTLVLPAGQVDKDETVRSLLF